MPGGTHNEPTSWSAAIQDLLMQVTPDNVLQVHHDVQAEVVELTQELLQNGYRIQVGIAADESVSKTAAQGFNSKIQDLVQHASSYVDQLQGAADAVKAQAVRYGHTEQEVKRSFERFQAGNR